MIEIFFFLKNAKKCQLFFFLTVEKFKKYRAILKVIPSWAYLVNFFLSFHFEKLPFPLAPPFSGGNFVSQHVLHHLPMSTAKAGQSECGFQYSPNWMINSESNMLLEFFFFPF